MAVYTTDAKFCPSPLEARRELVCERHAPGILCPVGPYQPQPESARLQCLCGQSRLLSEAAIRHPMTSVTARIQHTPPLGLHLIEDSDIRSTVKQNANNIDVAEVDSTMQRRVPHLQHNRHEQT